MPTDSEQVTALGVLARAHQDSVCAAVSDATRLRVLLREYFPAALVALLNLAPHCRRRAECRTHTRDGRGTV